MTYTVTWKPRADRELAELWLQAPDRNLVAHAVHQIDTNLRTRPLEVGESREGTFRILCILPLVVGYRVSEPDRLVEVVRIRAI
jgi:mRNA-degrading endonuclease RelE of RelBE toxin-antitoxin system